MVLNIHILTYLILETVYVFNTNIKSYSKIHLMKKGENSNLKC